MKSIRLHIYTVDNSIKNCSINIFNTNKIIESSIEECDIAILFLDNPLPYNFNIMLEKLWKKKIILVFCGDSACYFDKLLLNLTNVIAIWSHTIFVDRNLLKKPTLNLRYRDYLITGESNSYHQKLKILHTEKVKSLFAPIKYTCSTEAKKLYSRFYDICFLGTKNYQNQTNVGNIITKNKNKGIEIIENMKTQYNIITGKLPYDKYINTLKDTKICISPQGWGEFSKKDYEALGNGCIVIKNCGYKLKSTPNIYNNIIYCNFNYDNLVEKINNILQNIDDYQDMVNEGRKILMNFDENEHINKISDNIIQSYNKYEINHCNFENIFIFQEHLLDNYQIINNNINFYLNSIIDEKQFFSFGFFPITDYYIYYQNKCFQNKKYKCKINFKSNLNKIRYYDGNKWNIILSNNKEYEIEYEQDFSKYIKSRIGFCYENDLKIIEITQLDYSISII